MMDYKSTSGAHVVPVLEEKQRESLLWLMIRLRENVSALGDVLDGTWGQQEVASDELKSRAGIPVEESMEELYQHLHGMIEQVQGIRNRLERLCRGVAD
jgi:hypothetical protein